MRPTYAAKAGRSSWLRLNPHNTCFINLPIFVTRYAPFAALLRRYVRSTALSGGGISGIIL